MISSSDSTDDNIHLTWMREAMAMVRPIHYDTLAFSDRTGAGSARGRRSTGRMCLRPRLRHHRQGTQQNQSATERMSHVSHASPTLRLMSALCAGLEARRTRSYRSHPRGYVSHATVFDHVLSPRQHDALCDGGALHHVCISTPSAGSPSSVLWM